MSLPGWIIIIIELNWTVAPLLIFVLYNLYLILMTPPPPWTFSNILWNLLHPMLNTLLFYCLSRVWMVWSAASVWSMTVQIKRFSSFATSLVRCRCLLNFIHTFLFLSSLHSPPPHYLYTSGSHRAPSGGSSVKLTGASRLASAH